MATLAQITDLHLDDFLALHYGVDTRKNAERVFQAVKDAGIKEVVLTGDLGVPESLGWLFDTVRRFGLKFCLIRGNHDELEPFEHLDFVKPWLQPGGIYYQRELRGTDCLFLDSSSTQIDDRQLGWLEAQLVLSSEDVAVFIHHPVLDCGVTMDRRWPLKNRDEVKRVLEASGRTISLFSGHYHNNYEVRDGELTQYVTPSTMIQFLPDTDDVQGGSREIAYRKITFDNGKIGTEVVDLLAGS